VEAPLIWIKKCGFRGFHARRWVDRRRDAGSACPGGAVK
jgi:hypothetical protein